MNDMEKREVDVIPASEWPQYYLHQRRLKWAELGKAYREHTEEQEKNYLPKSLPA